MTTHGFGKYPFTAKNHLPCTIREKKTTRIHPPNKFTYIQMLKEMQVKNKNDYLDLDLFFYFQRHTRKKHTIKN